MTLPTQWKGQYNVDYGPVSIPGIYMCIYIYFLRTFHMYRGTQCEDDWNEVTSNRGNRNYLKNQISKPRQISDFSVLL